jgi:hypothetical protein
MLPQFEPSPISTACIAWAIDFFLQKMAHADYVLLLHIPSIRTRYFFLKKGGRKVKMPIGIILKEQVFIAWTKTQLGIRGTGEDSPVHLFILK